LLKKLKIELLYDAAIPLLGIRPKECVPGYRVSCTPMFIAALFTMAKVWKQPKCPIIDKWIEKMWNTYSMVYYLAIKKNEIMLFAGMDGTGEHHVKQSKPGLKSQRSYVSLVCAN
jgi:hypothetical protein